MSTSPVRRGRCPGFLLVLAAVSACAAEPPGPAVPPGSFVLTYIANEGVLLSAGERKVLVDALFDQPNPEYRAPAPDVLVKMMSGAPPFDGVDLVLVTHDHPDHFAAPLAVRYLEAFPRALLVAPDDAVAAMQKAAADWTRIESRVLSPAVRVGEKERLEPAGIPVTAFRTLHSGNRASPHNFMYLVELAGWRVFHEGDSSAQVEQFAGFGLGSAAIDLALVHAWFPTSPDGERLLQEVLAPRHIALMHLPIRLDGETPAQIDAIRKDYPDIFLLRPGMPPRVFDSGERGQGSRR